MRLLSGSNANLRYSLFGIVLTGFVLTSCRDTDGIYQGGDEEDLTVNSFFDYSTEQTVQFNVQYKAVSPVRFEVFAEDPLLKVEGGKDANGNELVEYRRNPEVAAMAAGFTDKDGKLSKKIVLPASLKEVYIYTDNIAVPALYNTSISSGAINANITNSNAKVQSRADGKTLITSYQFVTAGNKAQAIFKNEEAGDFRWHTDGAPAKSVTEAVDAKVIETANMLRTSYTNSASKFQSKKADFLDKHLLRNDFVVANNGEVKLQVLSTNCAYYSSLAYYIYDGKMASLSDLENLDKYLVLPLARAQDATQVDGGANLKPLVAPFNGSTDAETITLINPADGTTQFKAGTKIGFVLFVDSYDRSDLNNVKVRTNQANYTTSITGQNFITIPETPASDFDYTYDMSKPCQMSAAIKVDGIENYEVFGFEDQRYLSWYVDTDFDDVIFGVNNVKGNEETDTPAPVAYEKKGLLMIEDNWPDEGDYDMNDVVAEYHIINYINNKNELVKTDYTFTIVWAGADYHNSLAILLPNSVNSIEDLGGNNGITRIANSNLGATNGRYVLICQNIRDWFSLKGPLTPGVVPTFNFVAHYADGTSGDVANEFNPFAVSKQFTGLRPEIHLIGQTPSTLMLNDPTVNVLFNTKYDNSYTTQSDGKVYWYAGKNYLPFAINLVDADGSILALDFYKYNELKPINTVFKNFTPWANRTPGYENIQWWNE